MLALLSRRSLDAGTLEMLHNLDIASLHQLLAVAVDLRVAGAVLRRIEQELAPYDDASSGNSRQVSAVRDAVQSEMHGMRRVAATQDMERERVMALLHRSGISPMLLKGAALRLSIYPDPAERMAGDIDMLLAPELIPHAIETLNSAGYQVTNDMDVYRRWHFHHALRNGRGQLIELHWALTPPGAPATIDAAQMIQDAVLLKRRQGAPVLIPRAEDLLVHLISQNTAEPERLLARGVDIDRIVASNSAFDWDSVVSRLSAAGLKTAAWASLSLGSALLGTQWPETVELALRPPTSTIRRLRAIHLEELSLIAPATRDGTFRLVQLYLTADQGGLLPAMRWLSRAGFPGPQLQAQRQPEGKLSALRRFVSDATPLMLLHAALSIRKLPSGKSRL